jgi:starvation-inducible DNA-binding protein
MAISIGIAKKDREAVARHLSKLLADTYSLYLKTHSFHWNVTGPQFNSLHAMFETQYNELWLAADEVAERIRTLDVFAPGSYSQFAKLSSIKEESGVPEWKEMVGQLVEGHEVAAATARDVLKAANAAEGARKDRLDAALAAQVSKRRRVAGKATRTALPAPRRAPPQRPAPLSGSPGRGGRQARRQEPVSAAGEIRPGTPAI